MKPKYFAVVGNPIAHSLSPHIHHVFAEQCGINLRYDKFCVETEGTAFEDFVKDFFKQGGSGLNITSPFKQSAFALADTLTERARLACAVNALIPFSGGVQGDNTDGVGLIQDLIQNQKQVITGRRILILGSGGATKGILPALLAESPEKIIVASRNSEKSNTTLLSEVSSERPLGSSLNYPVFSLPYEKLSGPYDLIINATPLSLSNQLPKITPAILHSSSLCYDLVYDKSRETAFTRWAKDHGVLSCDGLGMLVGQAAESFYQWHGVRPVQNTVIRSLAALLSLLKRA
jgi:shikimate dehydrogenase